MQTAAGISVHDSASGRRVAVFPALKGLQVHVRGKALAQLEARGLLVAGGGRITFTPLRELFR